MTANEAQAVYWNEQAGPTWVAMQPMLDAQIAPLGLAAIEALAPKAGEHVLDVGCGCGDTTLDLARRVGAGGAVVGVDLSEPMLAVAAGRGAAVPQARFVQQDAQSAVFERPFDAAFSRFGVMFFADPVAAFSNIRAALRPGGRLAFVCWRQPQENPWMMVPLEAALSIVPPAPPEDSTAPGPFAFADAARIWTILEDAGFSDIAVRAFDAQIGGLGLAQAVEVALRVGPLGRALRENPALREPVAGLVRDALAGYVTADGVRMGAGVWIVTARR